MERIINHFTDDDLYKFTMCCAVIDNFPRAQVKYRFTDRDHTVYPPGFADELQKQIILLEDVVITDEEIAFMKRRCSYIPGWFYTYLKGYRFCREWVTVRQDEEGHLSVEFEGSWADTILLEVKVLAIISELYYRMTGEDSRFDYEDYYRKTYRKAVRLLEAGCVFSDFGTRRRVSFEAEETVVRAMRDCYRSREWSGKFVGTSNVYLAMKYDLIPVGTMAHEFVCAVGGMYGPQMANHIAMNSWRNTFRGALGTNTTLRPGVLPTFFRDRHALHKRLRGREAHEHRHQTGGRENHRVMDFLQRYLQAERRRRQAYRQARSDSPFHGSIEYERIKGGRTIKTLKFCPFFMGLVLKKD